MASQAPHKSSEQHSYTAMSVGDTDLEGIGAHCQMPFCHQLDFLPFRCESCKGKFCLDHRTETAHSCSKAGAWARSRREQVSPSSSTIKPTILNHESQCAQTTCKTLINTTLVPGIECARCNRSYCLKHRMEEDHACATLTPIGARPGGSSKEKDKRISDAMGKLRAWGAAKKASSSNSSRIPAPTTPSASRTATTPSKPKASPAASEMSSLQRIISPFTSARRAKPSAASSALATLKSTAKGDAKIPPPQRIYVYLEAVASGEGRAGAKIPQGVAFFSAEWSVGRVLDAAAKMLDVTNVNNRGGGEEEKLRVFWIEGGRLLDFSNKLGPSGCGVKTGDTLVLLRGVGAGMASAP